MSDVFIAENPTERSYVCPGCKKGIRSVRMGESSSYIVYDAYDDPTKRKGHSCGYKGDISVYLLGKKKEKEIK